MPFPSPSPSITLLPGFGLVAWAWAAVHRRLTTLGRHAGSVPFQGSSRLTPLARS